MENTAKVIDLDPKDGIKPQWKYLHDVLKDYDYETEFSYAQLEHMTGLAPATIQALKKKVDRELKKSNMKMLANIRGFGYRIASPKEQAKKAKTHEGKGKRQFSWAEEVLDNMDTSEMTLDEKQRLLDLTNFIQEKNRLARKRSLKSLDQTQTAAKKLKQSEKEQKANLDELNSLMTQMKSLKERLEN